MFPEDDVEDTEKVVGQGIYSSSRTFSSHANHNHTVSLGKYQYGSPYEVEDSRNPSLIFPWELSSSESTGSPLTFLRSGMVDPFDVYPPGLPRQVVGRFKSHKVYRLPFSAV